MDTPKDTSETKNQTKDTGVKVNPHISTYASAHLPSRFGDFTIYSFEETFDGKDHVAITAGELKEPVTVRIHSECLTGDVLGSFRCDCRAQLESSLEYISIHGGMVLYLRQEGRGIGLREKIKAYQLQDLGEDTISANLKLGYGVDQRDYTIAAEMLKLFNIRKIKLLTNNPKKIEAMKKNNIEVVDRIPLEVGINRFNKDYLEVKKNGMGHILQL